VDIDRLAAAGIPVVVDSMYGAGAGCMTSLFQGKPLKLYNIRDAWNPGFPGLARPEPIPPHVQALSEEVVRRRLTLYESHADLLRRYYAELIVDRPQHFRVDSTGTPAAVSERVVRALAEIIPEKGGGPVAVLEKS